MPLMSRTIGRIRMLSGAAAAAPPPPPPAAASAGPLTDSAPSCDTQVFSQPFVPWGDGASYTLNPGGAFENGPRAWSLNGASVPGGKEPFFVTSKRDRRSLALPD